MTQGGSAEEACPMPEPGACKIDTTHPSAEGAIRAWLVWALSDRLGISPEDIDISERFSRYGLDSQSATSLSAELSVLLNRQLSPTLIWDHPTVEVLARYLAGNKSSPHVATNAR